MGVSPAKFSSAGQTTQHLIPGTYSRRNTVAAGSGVSTGNLVIIGASMGGEPLKLLSFADKAEAKESLVSGQLLEAVAHAFNGSNTFVPQKVFAMRVNNGTQAQRELKNNSATVLAVKSWDWGVHTNQIKMWLKAGTTGRKVTVSYKGNEVTVDNITKPSFSILYSGSGTGVQATINATGLSITSSVTAEAVTIPFSEVETLEELVARINDTDVFVATLLDTASDVPTSELDHVSNVELGSSTVTFNSDLQALIDALKSIQYVGSVTLSGTNRVLPENDTGYVYFTGATAGTSQVSDYEAALELLETEDIQIISTPSTDSAVHTLISNHCVTMSTVTKKKERTFIVGMPSSTTIAAGVAEAKSLNTELGSVVITGANANSPLTGAAEDITPAMLACKVAGMESALGVSNPLTNKVVKVNSFSKKYKDSELETMISGGVMPFGENEDGELVCIRGITTYQGDSLVNNERSMIRSVLYMDRDLRKSYAKRTGTNTAPSESSIIGTLLKKAASWFTDDLITKDDSGNYVFNTAVKFDGDKTYLTFERYVRAPNNFTFITGTNNVYSSTVEV